MLKKLILFGLALHLQGCAMTLYNWRDIPEHETIDSYSEEDKQAHYRKYAIDKLDTSILAGHSVAFTTLENPNAPYELYSYAPVIYQLAPETEAYFSEAQDWQKAHIITRLASTPLTLAFSVSAPVIIGDIFKAHYSEMLDNSLPQAIKSDITVSQAFQNFWIWAGIGVISHLIILGLHMFYSAKQFEQYEKIKETYNEALRKQLDLADIQAWQQSLPEPTLRLDLGQMTD